MKRYFDMKRTAAHMVIAFASGLLMPASAWSASLDLATAPLANATTTKVLPNLMFILDGSGSMDWNYLPDWVDDSICKNTNGSYNYACANSPLFQSPDVNGVYYNPAITYLPPVDSAGTSFASQTSWTNVKNDAHGIQSTGSTNLVTGYIDVEWCTDNSYTDCLRNDNYILPGTVNSKSYTFPRNTTSNGTATLVSGTPASPTTASRAVGPHYYQITPGEWCDSARLNNCQSNQSTTFSFPAKIRWCTNAANAIAANPPANACQGLRAGSYKTIRFPTKFLTPAQPYVAPVAAVGASTTFTLSMAGCSNSPSRLAGIASITINGVNILPSSTANQSSATNLANAVRAQTPPAGYSFGGTTNKLTVSVPGSMGNVTYNVVLARTASSNSACTFSPTSQALSGYVAPVAAIPASPAAYSGQFVRTDIVTGGAYPRGAARTDCAGASTCTYAEEMTNFANWWTYYQTRMQTMKSAASRAFKSIDNRYRVGFIDIQGGNYLPIAPFDAGTNSTKDKWYKKLFSINPANGTPLRSALTRVGLLYAGKKPVGTVDPMQYSCQQNFALLTTDGYWNTDSDASVKGLDGSSVGNLDGGSTARPMYEGPTASSNSLADAAKYYYDTDLRTDALGNCNGAAGVDVCENNVSTSGTDNNRKQHMTTFTLGLGVDGALLYTSDYKDAKPGTDFYGIKEGAGTGAVNWPVPVADTETAVDDLWHAAVNGQGTYFSAKDPAQLTTGLNNALSAIGSRLGAGSAAATSTLNPVAGDNFAYVASYTTVKWQGNLEARTINLTTGAVSQAASWCVEDVVQGSCSSPSTQVQSTDSGSNAYYCSTPNSTADTCVGGTLEGTICKVQMPIACSGTLRSKVSTDSDSRTIKMSNGSGSLIDFIYANLSASQKTYFTGTGLSQWADFGSDQKTLAAGANLVSYLRGQTGLEMERTGNTDKLYRKRDATLGDAIESQPAYVGKPASKFADAGYAAFITAKTSRPKTVYMGANDGMLHAFNAVDGTERWAFVPTPVIPNLSRLADKNYSSIHTNYVNGRPVITDVYDSASSSWKTILVAGLNGGGRGYYALDVTNPATPILLWEIDSTNEANLGYSYGYPVITKKSNGTWVVLFTSGYNNTSPGNGQGYLYVRNALTGTHIARIGTGVGDTTTPSGLAKITNYMDDPLHDNTSAGVYGGDLQGNVWRFDINAGTVLKFATLKDPSGVAQPVTAAPELGQAYGKRLVFVGTGKYLEVSDLDLTSPQRQTLYAIKDDKATGTLVNARTKLVQQVLTNKGATRIATQNAVDIKIDDGWFIDLPDKGERIYVEPILDSGLLIVPSTVPSNTVCSPGGYGWLNYFNYLNGNNGDGIVSELFDAPIVGVNYYYTPDGKRHISVVTSDNPTPTQPPKGPSQGDGQMQFQGKRVIWRELIP